MFNDYNSMEVFFLISAIVGGIFLVIRIVMQFVGADTDAHSNLDIDANHLDADVSFKLLSLQGLTSFLLMFGLVGLALYRQSGMGSFISIGGGSLAGLVAVWFIGKLFVSFHKLQSSGTVDTVGAIGSFGEVYLTIPENGKGRVIINFKDRIREFDAVTQDKKELKTGVQVKVVWVDGNTLVVEEQK